MSKVADDAGYEVRSNERVEVETLEEQAQGEDLDALVAALCLTDVRRVLEVGCGAGSLTRRLAQALGAGSEVVGVDISAEHIRHAERLATTEAGEAPCARLQFVQGDFLNDSFEALDLSGEFDLILEKYLLMYLVPRGDADFFFRRTRCLLRPGARLALIEADVNFGNERYPPPPEPLARVLPQVVEHYRRQGTIEWRCGLQLYHRLSTAGFDDISVHLVDGRIIAGGRPRALVEHACHDIEALLAPCLADLGLEHRQAEICRQWRDYLRSPESFIYTPIFLAIGSCSELNSAGIDSTSGGSVGSGCLSAR